MNHLNGNSLREMLSGLPSSQLETMLHQELKSETPDDTSVRLLLDLLQEREADLPRCVTPAQEAAWERYRSAGKQKTPLMKRTWVRAASILLLAGLLMIPLIGTASADSFWDLLAKWTDSVFQFTDPREEQMPQESYVFQTDHPGLQQLYDAVTELGITEPVVPMWLPDGYEIIFCSTEKTPLKSVIWANFTDGNHELIFKLDSNAEHGKFEYYKDQTDIKKFENFGTEYHIMQNLDNRTAVWNIEKMEIQLTGDCDEDVFYKILESIYTVEEFN